MCVVVVYGVALHVSVVWHIIVTCVMLYCMVVCCNMCWCYKSVGVIVFGVVW